MFKKIPFEMAKNIFRFAKANSTQFATAGIVIGIIGSVIFAVKAGKETEKVIEEMKNEKPDETPDFKVIVKRASYR